MKEIINVGMFGMGNVGTGVVELMAKKRALIEKRLGTPVRITKAVVSNLSKKRKLDLSGILNGTSNYILSCMSQEGMEFDDALKKAQEAHVHPVLVPRDHILSSVNGAFNSIAVLGEFMGPSNVYGLGAGPGPGPSAVGIVGDLIEACRYRIAICERC